jgi:hypothetical protein
MSQQAVAELARAKLLLKVRLRSSAQRLTFNAWP